MENDLIQKYQTSSLQPTLEEVIDDLDLSSNYSYPKLRDYLVQSRVCSSREFHRALHNANVKGTLGCVPENAAELIDAMIEVYRVEVAPPPRIGFVWNCPVLGTIQSCDEMDILREAQRVNYTLLKSKISNSTIEMAVSYWIEVSGKLDRQARFENLTQPGEFDWATFAKTFFEDSRVRREIQAAVMQKFIWSVKRRLAGLPVTNHLMVVIYGQQGKGKSKAVEVITSPLGALATMGDFQRIGDSREVNMLKAFVIVLDEMQKANHADVERVKNVVTRDHFNYKPLYTGLDVHSVQNATFIGTSNRTLDQMILDPTGNRRFFQIDWSNDAGPEEWAYLNGLDIWAMWRSVDHLAEDPTAEFMDEIRAIQEQGTYRNSVGQFFDAVAEGAGTCTVQDGQHVRKHEFVGLMRREDFFQVYRGYCDHMHIKSPLEAQAFYKEVRRTGDQDDNCPFRLEKGRHFNGWKYVGPAADEIASPRISLIKEAAA